MEENVVEIILKYGGWWKCIPRTNRRKYECGRQKTMRMEVDKLSLKGFGEMIKEFYDPAHRHVLKIAYAVPQSSPKEFKTVKSDAKFVEICKRLKKIEMFLTLGDSIVSKFSYLESIARKNPPRGSSTGKLMRKEFLHISESESEEEYPANEDDKYVALDELFDDNLENDADDEADESLQTEKQGIREGPVSVPVSAGYVPSASTGDRETDDAFCANPEAVEVENEEFAVDDADDCYSIDEYHSMDSSDSEEFEDIDEVEAMDGAEYGVNYVDPVIQIGKKFKDRAELKFCLQQHSVKKNFNFMYVKNDLVRIVIKC